MFEPGNSSYLAKSLRSQICGAFADLVDGSRNLNPPRLVTWASAMNVSLFPFILSLLVCSSFPLLLQNGEGIARKAGSGKFPHLSHVGKNHIKMFVAQNKYSSSDRVASDLATQQPGGEVVAVRIVRAAITCLKN